MRPDGALALAVNTMLINITRYLKIFTKHGACLALDLMTKTHDTRTVALHLMT